MNFVIYIYIYILLEFTYDRYVSGKEVDPSTLEDAHIKAVEAVCLLEETFPRSILTSQVHLMVHLVHEMSICGPVSSRWMFFLERFMKTLKDFVRQNAKPEGSMSEGWLIQEGLVFISQYLHDADPSLTHMLSLSNLQDVKMESVVPQGNGITIQLDRDLHMRLNSFCILNTEVMKCWVKKYEEERTKRHEERTLFRRRHGRRVPFPAHLKQLPKHITCDWLHGEMDKIDEINHDHVISNDEWEYARGANPKVCTLTFIMPKL